MGTVPIFAGTTLAPIAHRREALVGIGRRDRQKWDRVPSGCYSARFASYHTVLAL